MNPKYPNVTCSNCGRSFGPGERGFSHCDQHIVINDPVRVAIMALEKIAEDGPEEEPEDPGNTGNSDDNRDYGIDRALWGAATTARTALRLIAEHHPSLVEARS